MVYGVVRKKTFYRYIYAKKLLYPKASHDRVGHYPHQGTDAWI
jgi:hypothetical protein